MAIRGGVNFSSSSVVMGWCFEERLDEAISANLIVNGKLYNSQVANKPRAFLKVKKIHATGECGYKFDLNDSFISDSEVEMKVFFGKENFNTLDNFNYLNSQINKNKIFFLHIPKAGGTSLNEMLASNFENSKTQFHIEIDRVNKFQNINVKDLHFLSGHIRLHEIIKWLTLNNFLRITILRDPFNQLISHINWLKYISHDPKGSFFLNHPEPIQEISLKIREINFSNTSEIEIFLKRLSPLGNQLLNNCQTRYLLNATPPNLIKKTHSKMAIKSLRFFDIIGTVENYDSFLNNVSRRMGWEKKIELRKSNALDNKYGIEKKAQRLKDILAPLISADQILYDHVVGNNLSKTES